MRFVLSTLVLLALCLTADASDRKAKGHGAWAWASACQCTTCPAVQPSQPAVTPKPTEVPTAKAQPTIESVTGTCANGSCSTTSSFRRRR